MDYGWPSLTNSVVFLAVFLMIVVGRGGSKDGGSCWGVYIKEALAGFAWLAGVVYCEPFQDERFVTMMKVIQLEFIQELSRQFRLVHASMFDNHNVRAGVQDFYDNVIPQQVSTKASRLLNESLELTRADIYPTNADQLLTSPPPKTASQLMRAIQKYRIEKDQDIKQVLTYIWRTQGGALQIQLQVHLVCKTLLDLELLTEDHFVTNSVEVPTDSAGGMMTEVRRRGRWGSDPSKKE